MLRPAFLLSAFAMIASPAAAASYSATLSVPANGRIVARDINWACSAGACNGATAESRPSVLCQALAKQAGRIDGFSVDGRAFGEAELAKCNASARPEAGKAIAAQ